MIIVSEYYIPDKAKILRISLAFFIAVLTSVVGVVVSIETANGLSYGVQAARDAGEFPPKEVSLRVEWLMRSQVYANAAITGAALGLLLYLGSRLLRRMVRRTPVCWTWRLIPALFAATLAGVVCLVLACLAFRLQPMGSQNLLFSAAVHGFVWAGLGTTVIALKSFRYQGDCTIPWPVFTGFLWGIVYPTTVVLIDPSAYVERLFAENSLIGIWSGGGCLILLLSALAEDWQSIRVASQKDMAEVSG
ncbi:hypothetical protein CA11_40140 [Gimesia maris]|uniref:hypothetical protein n=1 Tax=Gimesia maris TaxID=122 RepID=UPI00118CD265|nr:hypothetical protein [Gimesia maris]QDU16185.1 hypothetical protein CA11_40140 [Gimesia maris]